MSLAALVALLAIAATPDAKPFTHEAHRATPCAGCHATTSSASAKHPGHDRCTPCHAEAFYEKPLAICTTCHEAVSLGTRSPLAAFAREDALRPRFDHKLHGATPACTTCHLSGAAPAHERCASCHEAVMADCAKCHAGAKPRRPSVLAGFTHEAHRADKKSGAPIECARCHADVAKTKVASDIKTPPVTTCASCHNGLVAFDVAQCQRCHPSEVAEKETPRSHRKDL